MFKLIKNLLLFAFIVYIYSPTHLQSQSYYNKTHTLMVYMVGSDLETFDKAGTNDLAEMKEIGSLGSVNIVVSTGGAKKWHEKGIKNNSVQRWQIDYNGKRKLDEVGDKNMGEYETLRDFITWTINEYPSDKYSLVLWNHGGGSIVGYGYDENFRSLLSLNDIQRALEESYQKTRKKFELIGFDACLMATIETANMLVPYANYMIASQELEPGHGWDYTPIAMALVVNPDINGADLGNRIMEGFRSQAKKMRTEDFITLSVIDLKQIPSVIQKLDNFVNKAGNDIQYDPSRFNNIARARSRAEDYGNSQESSTDMVDIVDIANNLRNIYPTESKELITEIQKAVVGKIYGRAKPRSNGLSIFFPGKNKSKFEDNVYFYKELEFSKTYQKFVDQYGRKLFNKSDSIRFNNDPYRSEVSRQKFEFGNKIKVEIKSEDVQNISEIYAILAAPGTGKDKAVRFFMGMDDNVTLKDNVASYQWTGRWLTLGGKFASMFLINKMTNNDGIIVKNYLIPIRLNGKKMNLFVFYNSASGDYQILGAARRPDKKTGLVPKELIPIENGDEIIPLFRYYDPRNDKVGTFKGNGFTVEDKYLLTISSKPLPPTKSNYLLGFYTIDFARNKSYSNWYEIKE